jgi:hypothetical protein
LVVREWRVPKISSRYWDHLLPLPLRYIGANRTADNIADRIPEQTAYNCADRKPNINALGKPNHHTYIPPYDGSYGATFSAPDRVADDVAHLYADVRPDRLPNDRPDRVAFIYTN